MHINLNRGHGWSQLDDSAVIGEQKRFHLSSERRGRSDGEFQIMMRDSSFVV